MRLFVCIKQVPDTDTRIKLSEDGKSINTENIKWILNPYDEFAVEEAIRIKEKTEGVRVTVVSLGPKLRVVNTLRTALAMGADDGLLINCNEPLDALTTAKALAKAIQSESDYAAIFTGKLAIDDNLSATGQMLAELLDIPHASVVSKLEPEGQTWVATREIDGGAKEVFSLQLPALVTATKGLNKPRFASLPGIMKAKKKPLKEISLEELGFSPSSVKIEMHSYELPAEKPPVKMIQGDADQQVQELVKLLREEAKVL